MVAFMRGRKLAVTYYGQQKSKSHPGKPPARIKQRLPSAIPMSMEFGPELEGDMGAVAAFRG
jgi:hypothetical protein